MRGSAVRVADEGRNQQGTTEKRFPISQRYVSSNLGRKSRLPARYYTMPTCYPKDRTECMREDGPIDLRFRIAGGTLLHNPERDARLPHVYSVNAHSQVHDKRISKIMIHVVDTSTKARIERAKFHKTLEVPLGPNALMDSYGTSFVHFIINLIYT